MPAPKKQTRSTTTTKKRTSSARVTKAQAAAARRQDLTAIVLFAAGIFLFCVALISGESLWLTLHNFWLGLFGVIGYFFPVGLIVIAIVMSLSPPGSVTDFRFWQYLILALILSGLVQVFYYLPTMDNGFMPQISNMYVDGQNGRGGGVAGAIFGWSLSALFGQGGAKILLFIFLFIFIILITGSTLRELILSIQRPAEKVVEAYGAKAEQRQKSQELRHSSPSKNSSNSSSAHKTTPDKKKNVAPKSTVAIDIPLTDEEAEAARILAEEQATPPLEKQPVSAAETTRNFDISLDPWPEDGAVSKAELTVSAPKTSSQSPPEPMYFFDLEKEPIAKEQDIMLYTYQAKRETPPESQKDLKNQAIDQRAQEIFTQIAYDPIPTSPVNSDTFEVFSPLADTSTIENFSDTLTMDSPEALLLAEEGGFKGVTTAEEAETDEFDDDTIAPVLRTSATEEEIQAYRSTEEETISGPRIVPFTPAYRKEMLGEVPPEEEDLDSLEEAEEFDSEIETAPTDGIEIQSKIVSLAPVEDEPEELEEGYRFPPTDLLNPPAIVRRNSASDLEKNADLLIETLKSFGVQTKLLGAEEGPTVTRYEVQPSAGVKISKITSLADDIALNLSAPAIRIEAPIPGKPAVGIEVPNQKTSAVQIREIIDSPAFEEAESRLSIALGKGISGEAVVADIAKMPHVLIAGATGSGKSVCINSIIISLLYKSTPDEVRLLMIDPKVVELGIYNGIPHLLIPVVTDPRKAAGALGWAVTEMQKRYALFAENNVRDLRGYNALAKRRDDLESLPQIVIIIDELADLMMVAPGEVEDAICRLAQMARAAGMHLVIATQRPSVDVITGVIKANIPTRIAFSVSSQVDSRTILDTGGAEKLLGKGDMLFAPMGAPKPYRVQGCFVADDEVEKVVAFVKGTDETEYDEEIVAEIEQMAVPEKKKAGPTDSPLEGADELLPDAVECVMSAGVASTSLLQRKLRLGYARAARIMDMMEEEGYIGPSEGSKPRQVLITPARWAQINGTAPVSEEENSTFFVGGEE